VVVNDAPTRRRFAKQQGKGSVRLVTGALQSPATQHQRRVFAQQSDFDF
jgi:hypothetical protein